MMTVVSRSPIPPLDVDTTGGVVVVCIGTFMLIVNGML